LSASATGNLGKWVVLALVGGVVSTLCDHLHATSGVLYYPRPAFWSQAWWVLPLFFGATLVTVGTADLGRQRLGLPAVAEPSWLELAGDLIAFVTAYVWTSYGHEQPTMLAVLMVGFWLALMLRRPRWVWIVSLPSALFGSLFEASLSSVGGFYYHHPDFAGVPRWLPALYLYVGMLAVSLRAKLFPTPA